MGRISEQTFLQRRYTKDKQVHEKMLNITDHQENANWQDHNEGSPHICQNGYYQRKQIINVGEDVEKGNLSSMLLGM